MRMFLKIGILLFESLGRPSARALRLSPALSGAGANPALKSLPTLVAT